MIRANYRQTDNHYSAAERQLRDAAPTSTAAASEASAPPSQTRTEDLFATSRQLLLLFFFSRMHRERQTQRAETSTQAPTYNMQVSFNTADKGSAVCGGACQAG